MSTHKLKYGTLARLTDTAKTIARKNGLCRTRAKTDQIQRRLDIWDQYKRTETLARYLLDEVQEAKTTLAGEVEEKTAPLKEAIHDCNSKIAISGIQIKSFKVEGSMIEIECEGTKEQMIAMVRQEKEGLLIERIPEDVVKQIKNQKQIVRALKLVFGTTIAVTLIGIVIGPVFDFIDLSIYGALTIGAAYTISRMEKMLGRSICMQPATNVLRVMEEMGKRIGETLQDMEKHLEAGL